jgi:transcriptional regulator with XRE-family HTH domain
MSYVRQARKQLGLSQNELGAVLGINQSVISRYETGELPVSLRTRLAIEALLTKAEAPEVKAA